VVTAVAVYRIQCMGCVYNRQFGRDREKADNAASKHVLRRPTHKVRVLDGHRQVGLIDAQKGQLPLVSLRDALGKNHQQSLKDLAKRSQTVIKP
jgi:hypothetical protein